MASGEEIVRQIAALAEELGAALASAQERVDGLAAELQAAQAGGADVLAAKQHELDTAEKRIETLVLKLKEARQEASDARDEVRAELQQRMADLEQLAAAARDELEQERSIRKRLEKGAAADERRLSELERIVAEGKVPAAGAGRGDDAAAARLQAELSEALEAIIRERQGKEVLEDQLAEAHKLIEALELAVKRAREAAAGGREDGDRVRELTARLADVEARLEAEQGAARQYAKACAEAEKRIAGLERALSAGAGSSLAGGAEVPGVARGAADKPLPHEVRPAPKAGAVFRPDWDLNGLPCKSADQVVQLWGSVFNVQLSLEGYPSQYCTAFLVVLKQGKQKQLYMVFNLKASKHVLVCVPGKPPGDEAALNKLIGEGQKYLQMSGFELEKIKPDDVQRVLESYFIKS